MQPSSIPATKRLKKALMRARPLERAACEFKQEQSMLTKQMHIIDLIREIKQTFASQLREIQQAITETYQKGYTDGIKAGKRLTRGKAQFSKPRGGQKTLPDILAQRFLDF